MNDCIVAAFWRRPLNSAADETRNYVILANKTSLSGDTVTSGTSDDNTIISTLLSVPGCFAHDIRVRAINVCDRPGPESTTVMLDPEMRHIVPNGTSCTVTANSGSEKITGNSLFLQRN